MKKLHIYFLSALTAAALLPAITACSEDNLDIENGNSLNTSNFWQSESDAEKGLVAVYNMFYRQGTWTRNIYTQLNGMADDGISMAGWTELAEYAKFIFTNYNFSEFNTKSYREHYIAINRANQVLDHIDAIPFADDAHKQDVKAQAKFLRAFHYYTVTNIWENVPVCLSTSSADDKPLQGNPDQIFTIIENDLREIIDAKALPLRRAEADYGRPTLGSAYALLAKTYAQHHKWAEAADALKWICEGEGRSIYSLMSDYGDNFREETENNAESLFEIQFSMAMGTIGYDGTDDYASAKAQLGTQIEINQSPAGTGWNNIEANHWPVDYFKREKTTDGKNDPRLYYTYWYREAAEDFPDRDNQMYKYASWNEDGWGNRVFIRKYCTDTHVNEMYYWNGNNFRSFRLADMYLLYAEALNEISGPADTKVVDFIDRVRTRAGLPTLENSTYYRLADIKASRDAMRNHIKIERALELGCECVRWFDLKRWGIDDAATLNELKARDTDFNNFVIGKSIRVPLPQFEVDNNPNLSQNPNY